MTELGSRDPDGPLEVRRGVDVEEGCRCSQSQPLGLSERSDHDCCREVDHAARSRSHEGMCCRDGHGAVTGGKGLRSSVRHGDHCVHAVEGAGDEFE